MLETYSEQNMLGFKNKALGLINSQLQFSALKLYSEHQVFIKASRRATCSWEHLTLARRVDIFQAMGEEFFKILKYQGGKYVRIILH